MYKHLKACDVLIIGLCADVAAYKKGQKGKKEASEQKRKDKEKKSNTDENDKSRDEEEDEHMDDEQEGENEGEEEDVENWEQAGFLYLFSPSWFPSTMANNSFHINGGTRTSLWYWIQMFHFMILSNCSKTIVATFQQRASLNTMRYISQETAHSSNSFKSVIHDTVIPSEF